MVYGSHFHLPQKKMIFLKTASIYFELSFPPDSFYAILEVLILLFSFTLKNEFIDFKEFLIDLHLKTSSISLMVLSFYPLISKYIKFYPQKREGYPTLEFHFINRALLLWGSISFFTLFKYPIFSLLIFLIFNFVFIFNKQNSLIQSLISFILGFLIQIFYYYFKNLTKNFIILNSIFFTFLILKKIKLFLLKNQNENKKYFSILFKSIAFFIFDLIINFSIKYQNFLIKIGFIFSFLIVTYSFYIINN